MTTKQSPHTVHEFTMCFSSTPRGARLARRLCGHRLDAWGVPYGSDAHDVVTLVASELCANAVRHGHVAGRDFHLLLTADPVAGTVRIEVSDTRGERLPRLSAGVPEDGDGGRGLLLVEALADRWGCGPRPSGGPGKTVWAECTAPGLT
ncbi:serine/threonine protein kinase [Streptomyces ambofaciens]|uniref:Serine/threonine protein kinase n=1 Tax=Streptomyces ambofaciens TaxID=1889 RepID=A0ABM6B6S3_STRAM|nr:ATP-binding protein [Streptomyces ambofaciens]ANB09600.1 serine/threonine protein kinase [Streptomyces ambofaciens]